MTAWLAGSTGGEDKRHSAARDRMRRVKKWQSGAMALWWTTAAFDAASTEFRRIMDHEHLWVLKAAWDEPSRDQSLVDEAKASESASPLGTRPVAAFRDVLRINAYVRDHPVWKRV